MTTMRAYARTAADSGEVRLLDVPLLSIGRVEVYAFGVGIPAQ